MNNSLILSGLSEISDNYKYLLCDIWGVVHNGVEAFEQACHALCEFRNTHGKVILITNAPRLSDSVITQLSSFGISQKAYDKVLTSGDVTKDFLKKRSERRILHLGPERDIGLFANLESELVDSDYAELVVCTGLFDDTTEIPEDYREMLHIFASKNLPFVCANPDIIVNRGDQTIWCAGALARLYDELGGKVDYLGKPHAPIYELALEFFGEIANRTVSKDEVLAIGDGLPTDVLGANSNGIDVLFITSGIHAKDFGKVDKSSSSKILQQLANDGYQTTAIMPNLIW